MESNSSNSSKYTISSIPIDVIDKLPEYSFANLFFKHISKDYMKTIYYVPHKDIYYGDARDHICIVNDRYKKAITQDDWPAFMLIKLKDVFSKFVILIECECIKTNYKNNKIVDEYIERIITTIKIFCIDCKDEYWSNLYLEETISSSSDNFNYIINFNNLKNNTKDKYKTNKYYDKMLEKIDNCDSSILNLYLKIKDDLKNSIK